MYLRALKEKIIIYYIYEDQSFEKSDWSIFVFHREESFMFNTKENRYVTKGVNEEVPLELQLFCWQCIDEQGIQSERTMDYLQVFEINPDSQRQSIEVVHRQEELFSITYHEVKMTEATNQLAFLKVWVMDDGTNQTMLLPEEY